MEELNEAKEKITEIDYGNGLCERRKICEGEKYNISQCRKIGKHTFLNTNTGEVIEAKHSKTEYDCKKNFQRAMNELWHKLLYAINPILGIGYCTFVTLTFESPLDSLAEVDTYLIKLIKTLRYKYKRLSYCCFKELSYANYCEGINLYHIHCLFWFPEEMDEFVRKNFNAYLHQKWQGGRVYKDEEIAKSDDLVRVLFYLCNYSGNTEKSWQKRETLKHFPPNTRTVKVVKGLEKPERKEVDEFAATGEQISHSKPKSAHGKVEFAIFLDQPEAPTSDCDEKGMSDLKSSSDNTTDKRIHEQQ